MKIKLEPEWTLLGIMGVAAIAVPIVLLADRTPMLESRRWPAPAALRLTSIPAFDQAFKASIFSPVRAPVGAADHNQAQADAALPPPTVAGIVRRMQGKSLVLARRPSGQARVLDIGDEMEGWTLTSVGDTAAVFEQGSTRRRVRIRFGHAYNGWSAPREVVGDPDAERAGIP